MTIVSSEWPDGDAVGEFTWRISVFTADNRPVPLAGRSQTHEAALHDMVARITAAYDAEAAADAERERRRRRASPSS